MSLMYISLHSLDSRGETGLSVSLCGMCKINEAVIDCRIIAQEPTDNCKIAWMFPLFLENK